MSYEGYSNKATFEAVQHISSNFERDHEVFYKAEELIEALEIDAPLESAILELTEYLHEFGFENEVNCREIAITYIQIHAVRILTNRI